MKRRKFVRIQIILLFVVVVLLIGRATVFKKGPSGVVVLEDLEARSLRHRASEVRESTRLAIAATGSFEQAPQPGKQAALAAFGWIVRRNDHEVIWKMEPGRVQPLRGLLAQRVDTLDLAPGIYDVYYSSYGSGVNGQKSGSFLKRIADSSRRWENESRKWQMTIRAVEDDAPVSVLDEGEDARRNWRVPGMVWAARGLGNHERKEYLFEVAAPTRLSVFAMGEISDQPRDYGWIEDALTGRKAWQMTMQNTSAAGGAAENRFASDTISLPAGIYRAVFETNGAHAWNDWKLNPPFDPFAWGVTLSAAAPADTARITAFDPWKTRTPLARIGEARSDEVQQQSFTVGQPVQVLVYAVGEITDDNRYDYGWIKNETTGETVWDMGRLGTSPAGGDAKNRMESTFLTLQPGSYTLSFQTDDSHAYDDWNSDQPDHPERWGVALFSLARELPAGAVAVGGPPVVKKSGEEPEGEAAQADVPAEPAVPPGPEMPGQAILRKAALGNEADIRETLLLHEPAKLHVVAMGEITMSGQYDYGWIERADNGQKVWEMSWRNTRPAGGDDRNRLFDGIVDLPAGKYVVRFKTDLSHAFGDFGAKQPEHPMRWGIAISKP